MDLDNKIYIWIINIIRISLVFTFFRGIINFDLIVAFVSVITLFLTYTHLLFEKKYKIKIPIEIEIIAVLFIFGSLFLGELHGFYSKFWWWDLVLHTGSALTFGFIGFMIMYTLYQGRKIHARPKIIAMFSFSFAVAIGALWEIIEFLMDTYFGLNMQKSGLIDTMGDLIVDVIGAAIASIVGYIYMKKGDVFFFGESMREFKRDNPKLFGRKKRKQSK